MPKKVDKKADKSVEEEEKIEVEPDVIEVPSEEEIEKEIPKISTEISAWQPKTAIGQAVKNHEIASIDVIFDSGKRVMETEIIDVLLPNLETDLLFVGQSKGKFGGGSRRVFRQTQKKTAEGNKPRFATVAVVGNKNGYIGIGHGKSIETVPAREKAIRNSKLNIFKIRRGCGSWQCGCGTAHSIPFAVEGRAGSVRIKLMPAPKGSGLVAEDEIKKILRLAGIRDVWCKTMGQTRTKLNHIYAAVIALKNLMEVKVPKQVEEKLAIIEGEAK